MIERGDIYRFSRGGANEHVVACLDVVHDRAEVRALLKGHRIGAIVADPPYSSGGLHVGSRRQSATKKYQHGGGRIHGTQKFADWSFDGLDQRSWTRWCSAWLADLRQYCHPQTYLMVFIDWRQIGALTDAIQMAGWWWRGVGVWDKGRMSRAPHKGYLRHQSEFAIGAVPLPSTWRRLGMAARVLFGLSAAQEELACSAPIGWATAADLDPPTKGGPGPFDGVFSHPMLIRGGGKKWHLAQKPTPVLRWLLSVLGTQDQPGILVDPFAGSLSGAVAADEDQLSSVSFEVSPEILAEGFKRLESEGFEIRGRGGNLSETFRPPRQLYMGEL